MNRNNASDLIKPHRDASLYQRGSVQRVRSPQCFALPGVDYGRAKEGFRVRSKNNNHSNRLKNEQRLVVTRRLSLPPQYNIVVRKKQQRLRTISGTRRCHPERDSLLNISRISTSKVPTERGRSSTSRKHGFYHMARSKRIFSRGQLLLQHLELLSRGRKVQLQHQRLR